MSESATVSGQLPEVAGDHVHVTVTGDVYQSPVHGWGAPPPTAHNGVMVYPHATDAPIAITPTTTSAPTNATRLIAAQAS